MSKNIKKILITSASLLMIASVGAVSGNNVSAKHHHVRTHREMRRYWHVGTPKVMRGKWHTRRGHMHGSAPTRIYRNYIDEFHRYAPTDDEDISHMHFHYQGHGWYLIKGFVHNAAVSNKHYHITLHAKMYSHHKMYYSGIRHGKYRDNAIYTKY